MNVAVIAAKCARFAASAAVKVKKAAPTIAVVAGSVGTVAAGVWAVKKTANEAGEVVDQIKVDIEGVKQNNLGKAALAKTYAHGGWKLTKVYAGPVLTEAASVSAILWGFFGMRGQFLAMSAVAAAYEESSRRTRESVENYRRALSERYGADFDKDILFEEPHVKVKGKNPVYEEINEDGIAEEKEGFWDYIRDKESPADVISPYAVIFDETSTEWSSDPEYNKLTLHRIQQTCNDMLHARGHLFLNEVYQELGLPHTRIGQMVGWISNGDGDGYVDFGIGDIKAVNARREFINGYEPSVILDFNVDGVIWDKI